MVPGEGPQPAIGMIIGEAPGFEEVKEGRPFVGRSGKLLQVALKYFGLDRADLYITNVVKEIPLNSLEQIRRPTHEEVESWKDILRGEIVAAKPTAILALGRTASDAVTGYGDLPFGSKIGTTYTAWHPAYIVRNGGVLAGLLPAGSKYALWLDQLRPWAEGL